MVSHQDANSRSSLPPPALAKPRWSANGLWVAGGPLPGCRWTKGITTLAFSDLPRRCFADDCAEYWRRGVGCAPIPSTTADRIHSDALLNEITTIPDNFVLVLDDYHVIDSKPVDQASPFCSSTCRHKCTWSSPPARIQIYPWPGYAPGAN